MPTSVQEFVAANTQKTMNDLIDALRDLPEGKRQWSPLEQGRTALDQAAECAVTNKYTAVFLENVWGEGRSRDKAEIDDAIRAIPNTFDTWTREKAVIDCDAETVTAALRESTARLTAAIRAVQTDALDAEIEPDWDMKVAVLPWEKVSASYVMNYPLWNMNYHEGQISYILTLLT